MYHRRVTGSAHSTMIICQIQVDRVSKQSSINLSDESRRQIQQLAEMWGMPSQRYSTPVIVASVERAYAVEMARRNMSDADFLGFLATYFAPLETS